MTITSAEENEKVYRYMREQEYESAYIGLHLQEKKPKKKKRKNDGKKVWNEAKFFLGIHRAEQSDRYR